MPRLLPRFEAAPARCCAWSVRALSAACALSIASFGCSGAGEEHPGYTSSLPHAGAPSDGSGRTDAGSNLTFGGAPSLGGLPSIGDGCASVEQAAVSTFRPIDVIFAIDNSSSMDDEIAQIQARLNQDLAQILADSGLDYRVILVSRYGQVGVPVGVSDNPICIGAPLGRTECSDPMATKLENGERFFHFSAAVESHDAWCVLLGGFSQPDEFGDRARPGWTPLAAHGYQEYLRKDAFKVIVVVTDDDVSCQFQGTTFNDGVTVSGGEKAAADFDTALLRLSPEQFGTVRRRNYVFHSIVGLAENGRGAWPASAPMQMGRCEGGSEGPGTGYQALSRLTGGLRYPSCDSQDFDALFNTIANGIVAGAELNCAWDIPEPPAGHHFDSTRVNVRYTSGSGASEEILNVADVRSCAHSGGWYYDDPLKPSQVRVCPSTCDHIKPDARGRVDVLFGCQTQTIR